MKIDKTKIERILRESVEGRCMADYQIAAQLNVATSTVSIWRNRFNIRPANKFERKFKEKYGEDSIELFKKMVQEKRTLQEIGDYFGFTREYARQVRNKLFAGSEAIQPQIRKTMDN